MGGEREDRGTGVSEKGEGGGAAVVMQELAAARIRSEQTSRSDKRSNQTTQA